MSENLKLGKKGENIALSFLTKKGYNILETNYRYKRAEVDIIATDTENNLRIIEVKTRTSTINPEETVDDKKLKLLFSAGENYKQDSKMECETFYDIIAINIIDGTTIVNYFEDVYYEVDDI